MTCFDNLHALAISGNRGILNLFYQFDLSWRFLVSSISVALQLSSHVFACVQSDSLQIIFRRALLCVFDVRFFLLIMLHVLLVLRSCGLSGSWPGCRAEFREGSEGGSSGRTSLALTGRDVRHTRNTELYSLTMVDTFWQYLTLALIWSNYMLPVLQFQDVLGTFTCCFLFIHVFHTFSEKFTKCQRCSEVIPGPSRWPNCRSKSACEWRVFRALTHKVQMLQMLQIQGIS